MVHMVGLILFTLSHVFHKSYCARVADCLVINKINNIIIIIIRGSREWRLKVVLSSFCFPWGIIIFYLILLLQRSVEL